MRKNLPSLARHSAARSLFLFFLLTFATAPLFAEGDLDRLAKGMIGSFSSAAQAGEDSTYFDIRLEVVPIWQDRSDGPWLYVEQAAATSLEQPYRQRVYHLREREDGALESVVYSLPEEPLRFAGAWKGDNPLAEIGPEDLTVREGCAVVLRETEGGFSGSTVEKECQSVLRGASYATSEVTVLPDRLESWDRGFDASGEQVWGATEGAYIFLRQ